jgi:acetate kinase
MGSVRDDTSAPSYGGVVLAVNPGSSSLKVAARDPALLLETTYDGLNSAGALGDALRDVAKQLEEKGIAPDAVGHRVVHGGPRHQATARVDGHLLDDLRAAVPLAPLHLPSDLATIEAARASWPDAVHVACFDTAFHANLPDDARRLPVATELADRGVRRYGFHGLSLQSVLRARPGLDHAVVAHLGSGCSVTAVADGRSRYTTMSLTPTGGMMSATRSGDLDPEIVLYLVEQAGYDVPSLRQLLDRHSGLAGLSGGRSDIRDLLAAEGTDPDARLAVEIFVQATATAIATSALHLDRFEVLVFTGGVGEHSTTVRERVLDLLSRLVDRGIDVTVVHADEQVVIDDEVRRLLSASST